MNIGSSNRTIYDNCAYQKELYESVSPGQYQLYHGKFENCEKCIAGDGQFWTPYMAEIVDRESDLRNINQPLSKCDQFKKPFCTKSGMCLSTYSKSNPIIMDSQVCPVVFNNIPRQLHPGYQLPNPNFCAHRQ